MSNGNPSHNNSHTNDEVIRSLQADLRSAQETISHLRGLLADAVSETQRLKHMASEDIVREVATERMTWTQQTKTQQ